MTLRQLENQTLVHCYLHHKVLIRLQELIECSLSFMAVRTKALTENRDLQQKQE